jgi:hypothetical protein
MKRWPATMLCAMLALALFGAAPDQHSPPEPHQQLEKILRRPMYQRWQLRQKEEVSQNDWTMPRAFQKVLNQFSDAIGDFWNWLFRRNSSRTSAGSSSSSRSILPAVLKTVAWTVVALSILITGIVLYKIIRGMGISIAPARVLSRWQVDQAFSAGDALAMPGAQWLAEAGRLAAEGNFRAVYRALYLALLSGLHAAGKIDFNRNRTNWTYVQRYRGPAGERETFTELTELFDRVWYGLKAADGQNIEHLTTQVSLLTRAEGGRA